MKTTTTTTKLYHLRFWNSASEKEKESKRPSVIVMRTYIVHAMRSFLNMRKYIEIKDDKKGLLLCLPAS